MSFLTPTDHGGAARGDDDGDGWGAAPATASRKPAQRSPRRRFDTGRRYEGRLWKQQWRSLNALRVGLQDARTDEAVPGRERLTNNSLIRIGAQIVLDHKDALKGDTEEELLQSLRDHLAHGATTAPATAQHSFEQQDAEASTGRGEEGGWGS